MRGFALTEIFTVGVVIAVLSVLVVTGIMGFRASDRDTIRISDIKGIQSDLKLYFTRWGHYPGGSDGAIDAPSDWIAFTNAFASLGIRIPNDPVATSTYYYAYSEDKLAYVIGARLERYNRVLDNDSDLDGVLPASIIGSASAGINCSDNNLGYCVGSVGSE